MKVPVCFLIAVMHLLFTIDGKAEKSELTIPLEAADAILSGNGPKVTTHVNGKIVENITLGSSLEFKNIEVKKAGVYKFEIQFLTGDTDRPMVITVNDYDPVVVHFLHTTVSWGNPADAKTVSAYLHLDSGMNTIKIAPTKNFGPNLVRFIIRPSDKYVEKNVYHYDLTDDAIIVASDVNETIHNLTDNNINTLYTIEGKTSTSILVDCQYPILLTGYLLSTGEDSSAHVNTWRLESSTDNVHWQEVIPSSTVAHEHSTVFHINHSPYSAITNLARYYRLTVSHTPMIQIAELQLFGIPSTDTKLFRDDMMSGGSIANNVSAVPEGKKGFSYLHLFDRDISTKYYAESATSFLVVAEPLQAKRLEYYSLTSCSDAVDRDIKSWDVEGYTGYSWEVIHEVRNFLFPCRLATMKFNVNTIKGYQAFRLRMRETNGSRNVQLMQWQLFGASASVTVQPQNDWQKQRSPITTPWYDTIDPANVLTEYPRPQMVRSNWMNLNGIWDFKESAGMGKYRPNQLFDKKALVPFPIESALSGLMLTDHEERPYKTYLYSRTLTVPTEMKGKRILLHFGAVDWKCEVYVNGKLAGTHSGGYDPFFFDITSALNDEGEQEIQVQFMDPTDAGGQPVGKQKIKNGGIFYTPSSGIWQTVWMESVGANYISNIDIIPDVDKNSVKIKVSEKTFSSGQVNIQIYDKGILIAEQTGKAFSTITIPINQPKLWSPDSPFLYDVKITLLNNNQHMDEVTSYFGMRKIAMDIVNGKARFMLNNKPVFLFGPLDQGFWPDGLYTAPSDEALIYDIEQTKAFGFNMTRKHIKTEPARWYYHCDRLGLMVWQDMVNAGSEQNMLGSDDWVKNNFLSECSNVVNSLKNHPSIVTWIAFNEGFGQYASNNLHTQKAYSKIKSLDDTRIICAASGWVIFDSMGEVVDMHSYPRPGMLPNPTTKQISVCGEYGGITYVIKDHVWKNSDMVYVSVNDGAELTTLFNSYTDLIKPLLADGLGAAVYTQLTDLEGEVNGLITYDRKVVKVNQDQRKAIKEAISQVIDCSVIELLPTALREKRTQWRYTTLVPSGSWYASDYDDTSWKMGVSGFGDGGAPNTSYNNKTTVNTEWKSSDIYLRNNFILSQEGEAIKDKLRLILYHDDDCEVYINGILAFKASGYTSNYTTFDLLPAAKQTLKQGVNTIAIKCKQYSGGQYMDAGLMLEYTDKSDGESTALTVTSEQGCALYLAPNPAKGYCSVEGVGTSRLQGVELFNLSGKSVGRSLCNKFDISQICKGIYLVQVQTDTARHSLKLIKE